MSASPRCLNTPSRLQVLPVPAQPLVVAAVEEVRLGAHGSDVRVDPQELQQRPGSALLHPDDDGLRELLAAEVIGDGDVVGRPEAAGGVRQPMPEQRHRGAQEPLGRRSADAEHRPGQRVAAAAEAVAEVGEEEDHGEEDGQPGLRLQVSEVERSSPSTASHGGRSAGSMARRGTSWFSREPDHLIHRRDVRQTCPLRVTAERHASITDGPSRPQTGEQHAGMFGWSSAGSGPGAPRETHIHAPSVQHTPPPAPAHAAPRRAEITPKITIIRSKRGKSLMSNDY